MPRIKSDGKDLEFTPGKNGSLTYEASTKMVPPTYEEPKTRAKTVPRGNEKIAMNIANMMMKGRLGYK
jgi:hypothetical protein